MTEQADLLESLAGSLVDFILHHKEAELHELLRKINFTYEFDTQQELNLAAMKLMREAINAAISEEECNEETTAMCLE